MNGLPDDVTTDEVSADLYCLMLICMFFVFVSILVCNIFSSCRFKIYSIAARERERETQRETERERDRERERERQRERQRAPIKFWKVEYIVHHRGPLKRTF